MERCHGWVAGEQRQTQKGTLLGGIRRESYWCASVTTEEVSSEVWQLEDILHKSVSQVLTLRDQLTEHFETGGSMNYFVALYGLRNYGLIFTPELMGNLSRARIELQLDVYPSKSAA